MTAVWNKIQQLAEQIEYRFAQTGDSYSETEHNYNWYNSLYSSPRYRRAHVEIVDNRQTHKIYILHSTVFAHFNDPSPIWGFDAVCGPNKITGAFHDFSAAGDPDHPMIKWFAAESSQLSWNKPRVLPDWAQQIFSPAMIAAGNVNDGAELDSLCDVALRSLDYYLDNVGYTQIADADYHMAQNRYCYYQKQNPHVIKSMVAMGVEETIMHRFVNEILFPEIN
jgi:hypothetical protein